MFRSSYNLKQYFTDVHSHCKKIFPFLCKLIVESYEWESDNKEIRIQSLIVDDILMSSRLLLTNTFYLILKNDKDSDLKLMDSVPDACWHAFLTWFFDKKHNNMYQRNFFSILEVCLKQANEIFLIKIMIKLNLIGSIYESLEQVYKNEVPFFRLPVESFFCFVVKIIKLIESTLEVVLFFKLHLKNK